MHWLPFAFLFLSAAYRVSMLDKLPVAWLAVAVRLL